MRAYEYRNVEYRGVVGRAPVAALEVDAGPYRLRHGQDAVWPPSARAYGGPLDPTAWHRAAQFALAVMRLFVPVTLLLVLLGASYLYSDAGLPLSSLPVPLRGMLLAMSDFVLPCTWFSIHLTNRRYGPGYAFAQLLAALAIAGAVMLGNPGDINNWVTASPALSARGVLSFGVAFLLANFLAITVFDGARGPRWWTAPLMGSLVASFAFSAIYYPAAFAGIEEGWTEAALLHFALFFGVSVLLLAPYWLLRPAMRPMEGRNGY